jgi:hypothetical protein
MVATLEFPVDKWPMPPELRKLVDRLLGEAINIRAGDYLMDQRRMNLAEARRDMFRRIEALENLSSVVRRALNAWGDADGKATSIAVIHSRRRARRKARRGW